MDWKWLGYTLVIGGAAMIAGGIVLDAFNFVLVGTGLAALGGVLVHRGDRHGR